MGTVPTFATVPSQADLQWWIKTRPLFYAYQTVAQSGVASATWTPVNLQTTLIDRDSGHVGTSGRYTLLTLGYYRVSAQVAFTGSGGTTREAKLVLNGTDVPGSLVQVPDTGSVSVIIPPVVVHATAITDYVELQANHDAGANLTLGLSGGWQSQLYVEFAGS